MSDQPYQLLPPLTPQEYAALRADIALHGVQSPIVVDEAGAILDGHNRAAIAAELGIDCPRIVLAGLTESGKRERALALNLKRRHLGQIAWAEAFRLLAQEHGVELGGKGGRPAANRATVARLAEEVGVPVRTAQYRLSIERSLADRPDLAAAVDSGEMPAGRAMSIARSEAVARQLLPARLPDGRFDVIYADPPWRFDKGTLASRDIAHHYPTLELSQITGYRDIDGRDVRSVIAERAVLFLWVPNALLVDYAPAVLEAWGFEYRTTLVWCKDRLGMGYWVRNQHELLVVAARGDMRPPAEQNRPSSVIHAPVGAHSAKPLEVYQRIEAAYPDARRVELFARSTRPGWASFGNQLDSGEPAA